MYTRHARYAIQLSNRQGQNPFLTLLPEIYSFPSRIPDGRDLLHVHGLFRQLRSCLQHCSWCDFILMDHSWFFPIPLPPYLTSPATHLSQTRWSPGRDWAAASRPASASVAALIPPLRSSWSSSLSSSSSPALPPPPPPQRPPPAKMSQLHSDCSFVR